MSPRMIPQTLLMALLAAPAASADTFLVTSNADSGPGTLRAAILAAEARPGRDRIEFRLRRFQSTILLQGDLPEMYDSVELSGLMPGGTAGDVRVVLDGWQTFGTALVLHGSGSRVEGFVLQCFRDGIVVCDGANSVVANCRIGLDPEPIHWPPRPMGVGIAVLDSSGNLIGGRDERGRNVVSGCDVAILIGGALDASRNMVFGNRIGLDDSGAVVGNDVGIRVEPALGGGNVIGGAQPGAGNVIAGSASVAIDLTGNSRATRVMGNWIGADPDGNRLLGNAAGLFTAGADDQIGGWRAGAGNVFAGSAIGIGLYGSARTLVAGNFIGTDPTGLVALPNGDGVDTDSGAHDALLVRNLIAFNAGAGVHLAAGTGIELRENQVVLNGDHGVVVWDANDLAYLDHNVIAENGRSGLVLFGDRARAEVNEICGNLENGVTVGTIWSGSLGVQNTIHANSIHDNGLLAIDLGADGYGTGDGVTPNDMLDRDGGPNMLQNFPALDAATAAHGHTRVQGTLQSRPSQKYQLDFFASPAPDASGYGEAETYLGTFLVFTNAMGLASFDAWLPGASAAGDYATATATDEYGNTSELSLARVIADDPAAG